MKKRKTVLMALVCPFMLTGMISAAFISMLDTDVAKVEASEITETTIAKIGTEGYESLEDAINAVQNNETIVVIKDFTYDTPITINNGKTFTIDFNDGSTQHSFRWFDMMGSQTDKNIFTIDDNSNVTVKNMRYLVGVGEKANRVFNVNSTAALTLTNMICSGDDDIKDIPVRNNGGTVVIDGGDITTNNPGGANLLSPVVQNLNNGTTTITGNGTFTMKNNSTGVAWLGNIVTTAGASTDADQENPCGTVIIENGTFNGGHIVDVNGKGTVIINDGTLITGIGPAIKTFHGGVKSKITVNNITTSTMAFSQVLEELNTKIDFQNGNVKFTKFCMDLSGHPMDSISIANGKFGPKNGTTDIHDEIEGLLADGAAISALTDDPNGYTYKVETHAHTYGTPTPSWNGNELTLTTSCSCGDEQSQTFTGTYTKVSDATCTAKETGKYVVTIAEGIFAGTYESQVFEKGELLNHHTTKVNGQSPTFTEDGFKDAYHCEECGQYFEDAQGTTLIGDETAYNTWKLNDGKVPAIVAEVKTVSEAYEIAAALSSGATTDYFIKVTGAISSLDADGKARAINITDGTQVIEVFFGDGNADYTTVSTTGFIGSKVTVFAKVQNNSGTYELMDITLAGVATADADSFAAGAYKSLDGSCETGPEAVTEAQWTAASNGYAELSSADQAIFSESDLTPYGENVVKWVDRYERIVSGSELTNFMGLTSIAGRLPYEFSEITDVNNSVIIIITVAITSMTLLGITLVLRKRKHQ